MKKVIIGDATLYHGDALEVLPLIKNVKLAAFDPPYKLESGGNNPQDKTVRMTGKFSSDRYDNSGSIVECGIDWPDFMPLVYDSLAENAHAYVMCNNRHVQAMLNSARWPSEKKAGAIVKELLRILTPFNGETKKLRQVFQLLIDKSDGFNFHNLLIWDKGTATPNRWYMKNCEFTGFFYKGKAFYIRDMGAKQLIYIPQESYGDHPTTKPVMLMQHYIEQSSEKGDEVLDPFMGSCSTGVAALRSGRKFIGIEKDEKFFELSCKRINEFYATSQQQSMI